MKPQHSALAITISERITEILDITGLTQTELAIVCELDPRILKSYRSANRIFTVESIFSICVAISVPLKDFFDFGVPLEIDPGIILSLRERSLNETIEVRSQRQEQERNCIITRYFDEPIELNQIIKIIRKEYGLPITAFRAYDLLKRHIGKGTIIKEYKTRTTQERESFQPKVFQFQKNSNQKFDDLI